MAEELETRIAVLEVKGDHHAEKLDKIEVNLKETHGMVSSIKERLDKQNGIIPHMAEDMKSIKEYHEKNSKQQVSDSVKVKILWGFLGALVSALGSLAIKLLLNK